MQGNAEAPTFADRPFKEVVVWRLPPLLLRSAQGGNMDGFRQASDGEMADRPIGHPPYALTLAGIFVIRREHREGAEPAWPLPRPRLINRRA